MNQKLHRSEHIHGTEAISILGPGSRSHCGGQGFHSCPVKGARILHKVRGSEAMGSGTALWPRGWEQINAVRLPPGTWALWESTWGRDQSEPQLHDHQLNQSIRWCSDCICNAPSITAQEFQNITMSRCFGLGALRACKVEPPFFLWCWLLKSS